MNVSFLALVGMPAVGKSTLSAYVRSSLVKDGQVVVEISIDDVLRIQCPEATVAYSGSHMFTRRGSFFILNDNWRDQQMGLATSGIFETAAILTRFYRTGRTGDSKIFILLELPTTELHNFAQEVERRNVRGGAVVLLEASRTTRTRRNLSRDEGARLPDLVMNYFDSRVNSVSVQSCLRDLEKMQWRSMVESTENSADSLRLEEIGNRVAGIMLGEEVS